MTYYALGYWIVEEQQSGKDRAGYGKKVIQTLSDALNTEFGKGFSVDTLENARKFYLNYQDRISEAVFRKFVEGKSDTLFRISDEPAPFTLSWSHYLQLMRIKNPDERSFYEIEATKSAWSLRTLQRQYNSSLYERLALSRNKGEVMRLAREGNVIEKPSACDSFKIISQRHQSTDNNKKIILAGRYGIGINPVFITLKVRPGFNISHFL